MPRRLPNLNQLRAFEAAARLLSFKQAAEELFVTQAAVSHQIKALEEYYGCRLFNRLNRQVSLTDSAKELAEYLSIAFDQIENASLHFRSLEMSGLLRVSATPFYANRMVLPYLSEFNAQYPDLKVEFDLSYDIVDFSHTGIDAALRYGPGGWPGLNARLLHHDRVAPVVSPTLVQGLDLPLTGQQIARLPLAGVEGQERYWAQWFEADGSAMPADTAFSLHQHRGLALDFALAGNAVALADLPLIRNELAIGSLVQLSPTTITLDRGIYLTEPGGPFKDARLSVFADWLVQKVSQLAAPD